jgi:HD superfamily phosphodiesterase
VPAGLINRSGCFALLAAIATLNFGAAAIAADDAPTPAIEKTGDWRAAVHRFAEANLKHPAWGLSHSVRDYELAKQLAAADHATLDDDVLYAAAYLHDVAAFAPFRKPDVDHQDEAARIVESMLAGTGFPMAKIEAVRGAIRTHMFARDPTGPEAIYLHDADALDWLGAIGVARVFGLVDPNGGSPDGPTVVKRLEHSLIAVPPRIVSKAGQARAPQRVRELEQFLRDLRAETANLNSL